MEGVGLPRKAKIDQKSPEKRTAIDKNGQNTKMEASDGRTRELRNCVGGRRPNWGKTVAGGSLLRPHEPMRGGCCREKNPRVWAHGLPYIEDFSFGG